MTRRLASALIATGLIAALGAGCSDEGTNTGPSEQSEFADYATWSRVEFTNAPNTFLGSAHQGADAEYSRRVYTNASAPGAGAYPEGTIFVKETFTFSGTGDQQWPADGGLLGMKKREAGFDAAGADWEFFVLNPATAKVEANGADLMGGACKACHANATGSDGHDRIFAHPVEFAATADAFADYAGWHEVGSEQGPDPLLGPAHNGNDANTVRTIYRKQLAANPAAGGGSYPTGTMIVKEVRDGNQDILGMVGLVKRGADFDTANDNWEWFILDNADFTVTTRGAGADVMAGACVGCHNAANVAGNGRNYVFAHDGDPFNN